MRRSIITLLLLFACAQQAVAAEPIILVTASYPPFSYEEDGQQKGLAVELIKAAFQRMRQEVRIEFVPFARAVEMVKNGDADGVFPFAISDERKAFALFSTEKLLTDPGSLFVRADSTITFDGDYAKLAPYTIGMQRGTNHGPAFMQALTTYGIKTDLAENQEKNVLKLVSGRFEIAVGPRLVVLHAARQVGKISEIKMIYGGVSEGHAYLAVSKRRNREALIAEFDQAISKMRRDGSYDKILRAY